MTEEYPFLTTNPDWNGFDAWGEMLNEFAALCTDASRNGSKTTGEKHSRRVDNWAIWLEEERDKSIFEADHIDLRKWLRKKHREGYSNGTLNNMSNSVSTFFKTVKEMSEEPEEYDFPIPEIVENPREELSEGTYEKYLKGKTNLESSDFIQQNRGVYYITYEDIMKLIEEVPAPRWRNELLVKLQYATGLRAGELLSIKMHHIDTDERSIFVPAKKSVEDRTVWYGNQNPRFVELPLQRWLDGGRSSTPGFEEGNEWLFPSHKGGHISVNSYNEIVRESAKEAGIQKVVDTYANGNKQHLVTSHTLRHSYAVQAVKSGVDVRSLAELMGHGDISTTMVYLKIAEDDAKRAAEQFNPTATFG